MLSSQHLFLIPTNLDLLDAIVSQKMDRLSAMLGGIGIAEGWMHFPEAMVWIRDYMQEHSIELDWWNYLIIHQKDAMLIGTCGFKGTPDHEGSVEIGYEIAPSYQGRGLAKEAARRLCAYAFEHDAVKQVKAMTLAEENASVGLLRALGFQFLGEHVDIEDGNIWEWALPRPTY